VRFKLVIVLMQILGIALFPLSGACCVADEAVPVHGISNAVHHGDSSAASLSTRGEEAAEVTAWQGHDGPVLQSRLGRQPEGRTPGHRDPADCDGACCENMVCHAMAMPDALTAPPPIRYPQTQPPDRPLNLAEAPLSTPDKPPKHLA
jgi:hypothetical protein